MGISAHHDDCALNMYAHSRVAHVCVTVVPLPLLNTIHKHNRGRRCCHAYLAAYARAHPRQEGRAIKLAQALTADISTQVLPAH